MSTEPAITDGAGYTPRDGFLDEVFAPDGTVAPYAAELVAALDRLGPDGLTEAGRRRDAIFLRQGITFELTGEDGPRDRPLTMDLGPRIIPAADWRVIKRGLAQRIRALNAFVDDAYHSREIVRAGLVPWELVVSRAHFTRAVHGIRPPGGVYTHVAGCDLVRDGDGTWKVLEDNVRVPSGISYVLENRVAMTRLLPELFAPLPRPRRSTTTRSSCSPPCARSRRAPTRRRPSSCWTPGPVQLGVLRARVPRAPDGRRARGGGRPRRARRRPLHAHDGRPGARPRGVPAPGRRLRRPARVPSRLRARRARPRPRLPRRHGRDRQRHRHRRRRRQGDLPLRAGHDPLLPRRGAAAAERAHVPAGGRHPARARAVAAARARRQADGRVGRQGRVHRPADAARRARGARGRHPRAPGEVDRPGGREALDRPHRRARRDDVAPARRPAPVRRLRRGHLDRPRRPHARRAARRAR